MLHTKLRELREYKGITQEKLAQLLNLTREAYSLYEIGKRQMSFETLCLLADFHGVSTDFLLGHHSQGMMVMTEAEREIIHKYRNMDERGKQNVLSIVELEHSRTDSEPSK